MRTNKEFLDRFCLSKVVVEYVLHQIKDSVAHLTNRHIHNILFNYIIFN